MAKSAECGCLSPGTAPVSNVNHMCARGAAVVDAEVIGINRDPNSIPANVLTITIALSACLCRPLLYNMEDFML